MGTQDVHWDEAAVQAGKKFANKLWNIARYATGKSSTNNESDTNKRINESDTKILDQLKKLKKDVEKDIEKYELGPALHKIYDFIWHELADKYIEAVKSREDDGVKTTLNVLLVGILKILHPFMPFITEEIYQRTELSKIGKRGL